MSSVWEISARFSSQLIFPFEQTFCVGDAVRAPALSSIRMISSKGKIQHKSVRRRNIYTWCSFNFKNNVVVAIVQTGQIYIALEVVTVIARLVLVGSRHA